MWNPNRHSRSVIAFAVFLSFFTAAPAHADALCTEVQAIAREGDLVFTEPYGRLSEPLALTLGSWMTHVGLVIANEKGELQIAEARVPRTRLTGLCAFIHRSFRSRLLVRRLRRDLLAEERARLRASVSARLHRNYDLGFNIEGSGEFCSKLIHEVFGEALGVDVGRIVTFKDVLDASPNKYMVKFWSVWFGKSIPWTRRTITPPSVAADAAFASVFENNLPAVY